MEINNKEKRLLHNTIYIYLMRIVSYIFPLITTPYLTRVLTENGYGIYTWVNAVISYARLVVDFGFVLYGVEIIARCKNDKKQIGTIIGLIIKCKIVLCLVAGLVLVVLCLILPDFQKYASMIAISYLPVVVSVFCIDYVFQGMEDMKYITIRFVITKAIFTVLVFIFIKEPNHYLLVPVLTAIGDLLSVIVMWKKLFDMGIKVVKIPILQELDVIKKSVFFFWSRVFGAIYTNGNLIILGLLYEKSYVAQYSVAYSVLAIVQNLIAPIADGLYPYMVRNKNYRLVRRIFIIVEPLIFCACIIGGFLAKTVITFWFGQEYEMAAYIFCCLLPIIIITLPEYLLGYPLLSAMGMHKEPNLAVIFAGIWHVLGVLLLICLNNLTVYTISILTFTSELIVLFVRGCFVIKYKFFVLKK